MAYSLTSIPNRSQRESSWDKKRPNAQPMSRMRGLGLGPAAISASRRNKFHFALASFPIVAEDKRNLAKPQFHSAELEKYVHHALESILVDEFPAISF